MSKWQELADSIEPASQEARIAAQGWQAQLTKPEGSLGVLESLGEQLAGIAGYCPPPVPSFPAVCIFAGDHGVHAQGVTPWPQEVTAAMIANFLDDGAVVNTFADQVGAEVVVVDVGVATELPAHDALVSRRVRSGTADFTQGPAMGPEEVSAAIQVGADVAAQQFNEGVDCLVTGDMGIGNTTASAAMISVFTLTQPELVTGRGTGVDDEGLKRKIRAIQTGIAVNHPDPRDAISVLSAVGGLEHAALAGFILQGAACGVPVILDGVISAAAALAAATLAPNVVDYLVAGHCGVEPGIKVALEHLGLRGLVDLDLRLGEGSGGVLAVPYVQAAARVLRDVFTLDKAGI